MTAFSKVSKGILSDDGNNKDGHRRPFAIFGFWGVVGFTPIAPGEWMYTNKGIIKCPVFAVTETELVIIATLGGEVTETFGTTEHAKAKRWLDDQILIAKRFEADADGPPLNWQPAEIEIDIDAFMAAG